jgi:hypothetical protein
MVFLYFCVCFFEENWFTNLLSLLVLIVSACTLLVCYRQLNSANRSLSSQIEQNETERKSKIESNKSNLILFLQNLSTSMKNVSTLELGGDFNKNLFEDQGNIELQIFLLIADLKARTTNLEFVTSLESIERVVLSYRDIRNCREHADKAEKFEKYKTNLDNEINTLKIQEYECK